MKRWTIVLLWVAWIPHEKDLPCCILHGLYENSCQGTVGILLSFELGQVPSFLIYSSKNSTALVNDISTMRLVK
jgi:hypothetical protein